MVARWFSRMVDGEAFLGSVTFRILLLLLAAGLLWVEVHPEAFAERLGLDSASWAHTVRETALAFAIAILTALLLMVLVDRPIRKALERDVFRSVMGYLLPDAIREELRWGLQHEDRVQTESGRLHDSAARSQQQSGDPRFAHRANLPELQHQARAAPRDLRPRRVVPR